MMTYMEQFPTAEAYVLHRITHGKGVISKDGLVQLAKEHHVPVSDLWSKNEIAAFLMETTGVESLADACEQMGVSSSGGARQERHSQKRKRPRSCATPR